MTTKIARDFLDKELLVKRSIVTFRSLSRELGIHVNDAKNQLRHYCDAARDTDAPAVPTYLVSGEVPALTVSPHSESQRSDSTMDMDLEFEEDREVMDVVHQSKVLLVDARTLDEAMSQFSRIHSVHIYSLSPSRLGDAGLVCTPSFKVHNADAKGGLASCSIFGKITGSHVKRKTGVVYQSAASSSKTTLDVSAKATSRVVAPTGAEQQTTKGKARYPETKEQVSTTTTTLPKTESKDRLKPSGKLDWSRAKTKEKEPVAEKTREVKKPKPEPDSTVTTDDSPASKRTGQGSTKPSVPKCESSGAASGDAQKRGTKRKPHTDTDLEPRSEMFSAKAKPSTAAGPSIKKGVLYSDEDDDGEVRMLGRRRLKRQSTMTSDSEMSLLAMMDIDDEQVDRASRVSKVYPQREEEEESEEEGNEVEKEATVPPATSEDEESDYAPVVLKKRKPRKVVPVGRNGLKKRRVIKSRTTTDAKGYMQTEDYSSYESVEEEEEAEVKPRGKGKGIETKKGSEPKVEAKPKVVEETIGKPKAKTAPKLRGGAPKRGGLLNFFGPERGKK